MARSVNFLVMIAMINVVCLCALDLESSKLSAVDLESPKLRKNSPQSEVKSWDPGLFTSLISGTVRNKARTMKKIVETEGDAVTHESIEEISADLSRGFACRASRSRRTALDGQFIADSYATFLIRYECSEGCNKTKRTALSRSPNFFNLVAAAEKERKEHLNKLMIPVVRYSDNPEVFLSIQKICLLAQKREIQEQQCREIEASSEVPVLCKAKG